MQAPLQIDPARLNTRPRLLNTTVGTDRLDAVKGLLSVPHALTPPGRSRLIPESDREPTPLLPRKGHEPSS